MQTFNRDAMRMIMQRSMLNDDSGTNILIEYTLSFCVLAALFVMLILLLNQTINDSNTIVLDEQLGIIANQLSNRISTFASEVNLSTNDDKYYSTSVTGFTESIDLPPIAQGNQYIIEIEYYPGAKIGYVNVSYGLNYNVNRSATFQSNIKVESNKFYYMNGKGTISYDGTNKKIIVSG
jgi:hypothetical protein